MYSAWEEGDAQSTHTQVQREGVRMRSVHSHHHDISPAGHARHIHTHTRNTYTQKRITGLKYVGHLESKERFVIKKYLLIIGKKENMQVLSHTFTYFST